MSSDNKKSNPFGKLYLEFEEFSLKAIEKRTAAVVREVNQRQQTMLRVLATTYMGTSKSPSALGVSWPDLDADYQASKFLIGAYNNKTSSKNTTAKTSAQMFFVRTGKMARIIGSKDGRELTGRAYANTDKKGKLVIRDSRGHIRSSGQLRVIIHLSPGLKSFQGLESHPIFNDVRNKFFARSGHGRPILKRPLLGPFMKLWLTNMRNKIDEVLRKNLGSNTSNNAGSASDRIKGKSARLL